jgi:hypothetical protein
VAESSGPFWVVPVPALPSNAIFYTADPIDSRLGTGKGNGASRWSLVKYNQCERTNARTEGLSLVSMKNLVRTATTEATELRIQAFACICMVSRFAAL